MCYKIFDCKDPENDLQQSVARRARDVHPEPPRGARGLCRVHVATYGCSCNSNNFLLQEFQKNITDAENIYLAHDRRDLDDMCVCSFGASTSTDLGSRRKVKRLRKGKLKSLRSRKKMLKRLKRGQMMVKTRERMTKKKMMMMMMKCRMAGMILWMKTKMRGLSPNMRTRLRQKGPRPKSRKPEEWFFRGRGLACKCNGSCIRHLEYHCSSWS